MDDLYTLYNHLLIDKNGKLLALNELELNSTNGKVLGIPYKDDFYVVFDSHTIFLIKYHPRNNQGVPQRWDNYNSKWANTMMALNVMLLLNDSNKHLKYIDNRTSFINAAAPYGFGRRYCPDSEWPNLKSFIDSEGVIFV